MSQRAAGVLLHPTSLPGPGPTGTLGPEAHAFLDWLHDASQGVWQILPIGPVGFGDSPYDSLSTFAGSPRLISTRALKAEGLLPAGREHVITGSHDSVESSLRRSWEVVSGAGHERVLERFEEFSTSAAASHWLDDWATYAAIKRQFSGKAWYDWPGGLNRRDRDALRSARRELDGEIRFQKYLQFLFDRQWNQLRTRAREAGVKILGDLPFYVALDSADVWANRRMFDLDEHARPRTVAGVPPDYFSSDGQLWGNPIYDWDYAAEEGYRWWRRRIRSALQAVDLLRLDHFRAFAAYWRVPAGADTAAGGEWIEGPGLQLFQALGLESGFRPLIAEDLGHITPEVNDLRQQLSIPGMRVLQFGFDDPDSDHLPHNFTHQTVAYTGTHDNDTARGWFDSLEDPARKRALDYLGSNAARVAWDMIRAVHTSPAALSMVPVQDVLGLDSRARMNRPGEAEGNWGWRLGAGQLDDALAEKLGSLTIASARNPGDHEAAS